MQMRLKALQNAFEEPKEVSQSPGTLFTEEPFCSLFSSCWVYIIIPTNLGVWSKSLPEAAN